MTGTIGKKRQHRALIKRDGPFCQGCGEGLDFTRNHNQSDPLAVTIHHVQERKDGGSNRLHNLQLRHRKCHPNNLPLPKVLR